MRIVTGLVAVTVILAAATGATAQTGTRAGTPANAPRIYIGALIGPNFAFDSDVELGGSKRNADYEPGGAFSLFGGYAFGNGLRLEGEVAIRGNEFDHLDGSNLSGDLLSLAFMANGFYDIDTGSAFVPYLGVGIGFAVAETDNVRSGGGLIVDDTTAAFAYQFGGGLAYMLTPRLALVGDLRFFGTTDLEMRAAGGGDFTATYFNADLLFGLRFGF